MTAAGHSSALPAGLQPKQLARRLAVVLAILIALGLIVALTPGLDKVRARLSDASPAWIAVGVVLEGLSCVAYVLMFRPVFCLRMGWRRVWQLGLAELAVGSIVPASGAGGIALGAWVLHRGGMDSDRIARRSVAFLILKSSVNFLAVAVLGLLMAIGWLGPSRSLWLTLVPAIAAIAVIVLVAVLPRFGRGSPPPESAGRLRRGAFRSRLALVDGTREAGRLLREHDPMVLFGAFGYWLFDNAVLWAAYHAFGGAPGLDIILMGYLIGQLGGALPLPGGIGGIDGGLFGALVAFGAPAAATAAAVLIYRFILFWVPLLVGTPALFLLKRDLARERMSMTAST